MNFQNNSQDGIGYVKVGNVIVPKEFIDQIFNNFQETPPE